MFRNKNPRSVAQLGSRVMFRLNFVSFVSALFCSGFTGKYCEQTAQLAAVSKTPLRPWRTRNERRNAPRDGREGSHGNRK